MALDRLTRITTSGIEDGIILTNPTIVGAATATSFSGDVTGDVTGEVNSVKFDTNTSGVVVSGIITANTFQGGTFVGDGAGLVGVTASGSGVNVSNNDSIVGVAGTINFGTGIDVSPVSAGVVTTTVSSLTVGTGATINGTTDTITALTNTKERLRIASDGKVGIGTTNPLSRLHVSGTHNSHIRMTNTSDDAVDLIGDSNRTSINSSILAIKGRWNGTDVARIVFQAATDTTDKDDGNTLFYTKSSGSSIAERLRITSAGLVGIGTINPDTLLSINGSTSTQKLITLSSGTSKRNNYIGVNGADNLEIGADEDDEGNDSSIRLRVDGTERLRITSAGNVGIGTDDPGGSSKLHLYGATNSDIRMTATGDDIVNIFANSNRSSANDSLFAIKAEWNGTQVGNIKINAGDDTTNKDDGYITFTTRESGAASAERLRINSDGKVGINETSPGATLHVADIGSTIPCLLLSGGTATEGDLVVPNDEDFNIGHWNASAGTLNERIRLDSGGVMYFKNNSASTQLRIGTLDESSFENREHAIKIYGHSASDYVLLRGCNTADGTPVFDSYVSGSRFIEIEASGDVNSQGPYTNISDQRLKENIIDSPSQWDDVKALRVRKFNFTEASGYPMNTKIGFIAQEVEETSPGLVKTRYGYDEEGQEIAGSDMKLVKTSVITTKAFKALQEAMARIEVLESRLNAAGIAT